MKFVLEIACDNAAFGLDCDDVVNYECNSEVARILRKLAKQLESEVGQARPDFCVFPLIDINGNRVGTARFVAEDRGREEE